MSDLGLDFCRTPMPYLIHKVKQKKGDTMSHSYSIINTPLNKWAVIKPLDNPTPNEWSSFRFPQWLPANHTHMGIFNTLDEAVERMRNLRNEVK